MFFFVENLVVPVIFRKMFIDEVHKLSADVCLYVHAVGRVEPNYVSFFVLAAVLLYISTGCGMANDRTRRPASGLK